jgi:hypothetical protein
MAISVLYTLLEPRGQGRSDLRQYRSRLAAHAMMRALGAMHPV